MISAVLSPGLKSPWYKATFIALLFASFEFIRCEVFILRFPWTSAGYSLGPNYLSPIIGVYGCSLLIFLTGSYLCIKKTRKAGVCLMIIILFLGFIEPSKKEALENTITVGVVQAEEVNFEDYLRMSKEILKDSPQLIVWPEYALPYDVRKDEPQQLEILRQFAKENQLIIVVGTKTEKSKSAWMNTALVIGKNGILGEHYKNHPVHFLQRWNPW